jgi:hypothetical protein
VKLPNGASARVNFEKLTGYLLSEVHPSGRSKARFFRQLGFRAEQPEALLAELVKLARTCEVVDQVLGPYGTKYVIDGGITGRLGQARVRTVWIIPRGSAAPQLVTAYPAPAEGK